MVSFEPATGVAVTLGGKPFAGGAVHTEPTAGSPTSSRSAASGSRSSPAAERIGIRMKDPEAPARKQFRGIPTYAPSERWRIVARWEPSSPPVQLAVPNILGGIDPSPSPGTAVFTLDGKEYRLTPVLEEGEHRAVLHLRRRDQPHRDLRRRALPLRPAGEGRAGDPGLQPGLQPALRLLRVSRPVRCLRRRTGWRSAWRRGRNAFRRTEPDRAAPFARLRRRPLGFSGGLRGGDSTR